MSEPAPCPICKSAYTYEMNDLLACPECGHEWSPAADSTEAPEAFVVKATEMFWQTAIRLLLLKPFR